MKFVINCAIFSYIIKLVKIKWILVSLLLPSRKATIESYFCSNEIPIVFFWDSYGTIYFFDAILYPSILTIHPFIISNYIT